MAKLTLSFNLPEEDREALIAQKAGALLNTIWELDQHLRSINKHGHEDYKDPMACEAAQKIRDRLHDLIEENNIKELFW